MARYKPRFVKSKNQSTRWFKLRLTQDSISAGA